MQHYPHHIGDFDKATRHLTRIERSVYRDLMDVYYDSEKMLPLDVPMLCRRILATSEQESTAVQQVLNEFFIQTPTGWFHSRCDHEIEKFHNSNSQKSAAGKASAQKRALKKQQALNACSTSVEVPLQQNPTNLEPITYNLEPITKVSAKAPKRTLDYSCWPEMPQQQTLDDWLAMRKRLGADVSQTVVNQFGKELHIAYAAGLSVDHCLAECITSNWRGFKYSWLKNQEVSHATNQRPAIQTRSERNTQAHRDYIAKLEQEEAACRLLAGFDESALGD